MSKLEKLKSKIVNKPHLMIYAGAGCGKTTTLVECLKGCKPKFTPSAQQEAIWEAVGSTDGKVCMTAFNRAIADELKSKVPPKVEALTLHQLGLRIINKDRVQCAKLDKDKDGLLLEPILGGDIRNLRRTQGEMVRAVLNCCSLVKSNFLCVQGAPGEFSLADQGSAEWVQAVEFLWDKYAFDYKLTPHAIAAPLSQLVHATMESLHTISYDDMIWLPVITNRLQAIYSLLIVDEAQDLNPCQQELVLNSATRIVMIGDPNQAIYAFAGADSDSMNTMEARLQGTTRGVTVLPLNITRRCGKNIVKAANEIVKDFYAAEEAPEGEVVHTTFSREWIKGSTYHDSLLPGDMVLCRCNGPLVSQAFQLIKQGVKANIRGRDVGKGLITLVNKLGAYTVAELISKLDDWYYAETQKEQAKKFPSDTKIMYLTDRYDCIHAFCANQKPDDRAAEVVLAIENVFSDTVSTGVTFSSIHKAKGLEADRVHLLQVEKGRTPHPMAKTEEARKQEYNLLYVAYTRAKTFLQIVTEPPKSRQQ